MQQRFRHRARPLHHPRLVAFVLAAWMLCLACGPRVSAAAAPRATAGSASPAPHFSDVSPSFWGYAAIMGLARAGVVDGLPGGRFMPDAPVTRAQFAKILVLARHVPLPPAPQPPAFSDVPPADWAFPYVQAARSAGIVDGVGGGRFAPDQPVTRQQMVVMLGRSLHLGPAARLAGAPPFADASAIAPYARGYARVMARLGLVLGLPGDRFAPAAPATRAQAAAVTERTLSLPRGRLAALLAPAAARIALSAPHGTLPAGASEQVAAQVYTSRGQALPLRPVLTVSAGSITAGGLYQAGPAPGTVTVTARLDALSASLRLTVGPAARGLAFVDPPSSVAAGQTVDIPVALRVQGGAAATADSGRPVTLTIRGPDGATTAQKADDAGGLALFKLTEKRAGRYRLSATAHGLAAAPVRTLRVTPGPPVALRLEATPSYLLLAPGDVADLLAEAVDRYGNATAATLPVVLGASGSGGTLQVLDARTSVTSPAARFTSGRLPGTTTVTLRAPGSGLGTARFTLVSAPGPLAAISGRGMWLRYADVKRTGAAAIVARATADGISHLYLEVGSTYNHDGFWGTHQLDELLPLAHQAHIAVIAWIYDTLRHTAADLALARRAAAYTTPDGQRADGLALDLETDSTMTPGIVGPFGLALRRIVGSQYPLVAVTYPPQSRPKYPFAALAQTMTALAPMDYWNVDPRAYSPSDAADFVSASISGLRRAAGRPGLPVAVIAQAYDMFSGTGSGLYSPSGAEISAAMAAARSLGAVGFSLYEWRTATAAEWQALVRGPWN